jgi:predicted XRE-type DNA-binding protein
MNKEKRQAIQAAGFRIGDAEDFLELNAEERRLVELRVAISHAIRTRREGQGLTQQELAKRLKTSQPRVAMMESGASSVSLDWMFRGLFVLGGSLKDLQETTQQPKDGPKRRRERLLHGGGT